MYAYNTHTLCKQFNFSSLSYSCASFNNAITCNNIICNNATVTSKRCAIIIIKFTSLGTGGYTQEAEPVRGAYP